MGKGSIIAVVVLIAIVAVVAFIAYPMFMGGENKAAKLQPDLSAFPDGWKIDPSETANVTSGKDSNSRQWFRNAGETEHVVVAISYYSTVEKANDSYSSLYSNHGPGVVFTGSFDRGFSVGKEFYFQKGNVVVQLLASYSTLTTAQINTIVDNILGKIA